MDASARRGTGEWRPWLRPHVIVRLGVDLRPDRPAGDPRIALPDDHRHAAIDGDEQPGPGKRAEFLCDGDAGGAVQGGLPAAAAADGLPEVRDCGAGAGGLVPVERDADGADGDAGDGDGCAVGRCPGGYGSVSDG